MQSVLYQQNIQILLNKNLKKYKTFFIKRFSLNININYASVILTIIACGVSVIQYELSVIFHNLQITGPWGQDFADSPHVPINVLRRCESFAALQAVSLQEKKSMHTLQWIHLVRSPLRNLFLLTHLDNLQMDRFLMDSHLGVGGKFFAAHITDGVFHLFRE